MFHRVFLGLSGFYWVFARGYLGDGAVGDDGDDVRFADGAEPVRHDEDGATAGHVVQRLLHQPLRFGVQRTVGPISTQLHQITSDEVDCRSASNKDSLVLF